MTFRCSQSSREDREPLIGTAPTETRFLLVEHAGPWGRAAVQESRLPEDVRAHLAGVAGVRVQLIRRHGGESGPGVRVIAAAADPTSAEGRATVESAVLDGPAALLDLDLAGFAATGTLGLPAYDEDLWLVCTNGRRDLCCADLGRTTTAALAARWPEGTWETTHLGGHRFAATLLALPSLVTLGRLLPHEAVSVCADVAQGRVPLDHTRGRAGWPPVAQVADDHVRRELGLEPVAAVRLVEVDGDDVTLDLAGEKWRLTVTASPGEPRRQSCADDTLKITTVHRVESMVRVADHPSGGGPFRAAGLGSVGQHLLDPLDEGDAVTTTPDEPLNDDDMTTGGPPQASATPSDADASDADADGTDGDSTDGDATDSTDGDGSDADGTDADASDGDSTDSTDGDAS